MYKFIFSLLDNTSTGATVFFTSFGVTTTSFGGDFVTDSRITIFLEEPQDTDTKTIPKRVNRCHKLVGGFLFFEVGNSFPLLPAALPYE